MKSNSRVTSFIFDLCGCCHLRLLTSRLLIVLWPNGCNDRSLNIHRFAIAVSCCLSLSSSSFSSLWSSFNWFDIYNLGDWFYIFCYCYSEIGTQFHSSFVGLPNFLLGKCLLILINNFYGFVSGRASYASPEFDRRFFPWCVLAFLWNNTPQKFRCAVAWTVEAITHNYF